MRLMTLNTWGTRGPHLRRWELIVEHASRLAPEVLCLQEVTQPELLEGLRQVGLGRVLTFPEAGLAIATSLEVRRHQARTFDVQSAEEDGIRGALFAELGLPAPSAASVAIACTHLSWRLEDAEVRRGQSLELVRWLEEQEAPAVLAGDLNDVPDSAALESLMAAGLEDPWRLLHPDAPGLTWASSNPYTQQQQPPLPNRRIDYLLLERGLLRARPVRRCEIVLDRPDEEGIFPSDHYGLLVELED